MSDIMKVNTSLLTRRIPRNWSGRAAVVVVFVLAGWPSGLCRAQAGAGSGSPQNTISGPFVPGEVIVQLKPGAAIDQINAIYNTTTIQQIHGTNFYRLKVPANKSAKRWRNRLINNPLIKNAWLNPVVNSPFVTLGRSVMTYPDGRPALGFGQNQYASQDFLANLRISDANLRSTGDGIVVAVIDTGVDSTHPALAGNMWVDPNSSAPQGADGFVDDSHGWNFVDNNNDTSEVQGRDPSTSYYGHGTFVAGLIVLAAPGAKIMPIRAFTPDGQSNAFLIAASMKFAADHGANVINLSCGSLQDSQLLDEAINYAVNQGAVIVAAAGNDDSSEQIFPASLANVVGVGAVDDMNKKAYFSNFGADVDIVAPGVDIISTFPGGGYASWNGTSFSTPITAAEAALILALQGDTSVTQQYIDSSAVNIDVLNPDFTGMLGNGVIQPLKALVDIEGTPGDDFQGQLSLNSSAIEPAAAGQTTLTISGGDQSLEFSATGLTVGSSYTLLVNDTDLVWSGLQPDDLGGIDVILSTNAAEGYPLPDALIPVTNTRHVQLIDPEGRVVLDGTFVAGGTTVPPGETLAKQAQLLPPDTSSAADGQIQVTVDSSGTDFDLRAENLAAGTSYSVVADGVNLGSFTSHTGFLGVELRQGVSTGQLLPPGFEPAIDIHHVDVVDGSGNTVLSSDFLIGNPEVLADTAVSSFSANASRRSTSKNKRLSEARQHGGKEVVGSRRRHAGRIHPR